MKAVIFVLFAALVAVNAQTYQECPRTPEYEEMIDPLDCPTPTLKLPNYVNAQTYYQCSKVGQTKSTTLTQCTNGQYFSYVMQKCQPCETYLPTTHCPSLTINATCVPIAADNTTTSSTTTSTTSTTTTTTTTTTTAAPGESSSTTTTIAPSTNTTSSVPTPPTDSPSDDSSTSSPGGDDIITPSGTTINVPQPPAPGDASVPTPVTPVPTAPIINNGPPVVTEAPTAD